MTGPSVSEERTRELRSRRVAVSPDGWRSNGPVLAAVAFALTCGAMLAMWAFLYQIVDSEKPASRILAAASLVLAEVLIRRFRFFGTGVESALFIGGLFCVIFGLPGKGSPEAILLFAVASAIAGARMRNPLFGALAVVFVIAYFETRDLPSYAASLGIAVAAVALLALVREWRRPSTEMLWTALLVITPIAGAINTADELPAIWAIAYAALASGALWMGIRLRTHAPFIAAAVNVAISIAILESHDLLPFEPEWQLMIGGAVLLAASALIARSLHERTRGIVVTSDALTRFDEELQILGTIALQPRVEVAQGPDGKFGGAGATGNF